jgi:hypothetical protein
MFKHKILKDTIEIMLKSALVVVPAVIAFALSFIAIH